MTVTEIEVYDTEAAADPATGSHPVKARVRQRHDQTGTSLMREQTASNATAKSDATLDYECGELGEVTVTATKTPSLWERIKQWAGWATAIVVIIAAGGIIYKLKKQKT